MEETITKPARAKRTKPAEAPAPDLLASAAQETAEPAGDAGAPAVEVADEVVDAASVTTAVDTVKSAVALFDTINAGISAIALAHPKGAVIDCTTKPGLAAAKASLAAWREPRVRLEKARKDAKRPVLELGRTIDKFAGSIEDRLRDGEGYYETLVDTENARLEAERQRVKKIEEDRKAALQTRIDDIRGFAARAVGKPSAEIEDKIKMVVALTIDNKFQERETDAALARAETLETLRSLLASQKQVEAAAAEAEANRIELERLRAEQAQRDAEAEAARKAAQVAEDKQREEARAAQAREDAERAERIKREDEERAQRQRADDEAAAARRAQADREAEEHRQRTTKATNEIAALQQMGVFDPWETRDNMVSALVAVEAFLIDDRFGGLKMVAQLTKDATITKIKAVLAEFDAAAERERLAAAERAEKIAQAEADAKAQEQARSALQRVERAGPALLAALKVALPYVFKEGSMILERAEHYQTCLAAIEAAQGEPA